MYLCLHVHGVHIPLKWKERPPSTPTPVQHQVEKLAVLQHGKVVFSTKANIPVNFANQTGQAHIGQLSPVHCPWANAYLLGFILTICDLGFLVGSTFSVFSICKPKMFPWQLWRKIKLSNSDWDFQCTLNVSRCQPTFLLRHPLRS